MGGTDTFAGVEAVNHGRWVSYALIRCVAVMKQVIDAVCDMHGCCLVP